MKIRPEKIQACTGFEPMTSAIPVQRSTIDDKWLGIYESHIFELRIKT